MFFFFLYFSFSTFRPDHEVVMDVVAPWESTPLFEQILFYFTDLSNNFATQFLTTVLDNFDKRDDEQFVWNTALQILPEKHHNYLKSQIELGFFNPRGETYREMARSKGGSNYPDLIVIGKKIASTVCEDYHFLESNEIEVHPFELQFGVPESIVYANLSSRRACDFVLDLVKRKVQFSLRPTTTNGNSKFGVNLRGFGIEMRPFKYSMEYGVKDSIVLQSNSSSTNLHEDETVSRFENIPFSEYINLTINGFDYLFTSWIREHENESLPKLMRDFTNNFPLFIPEIVNTTISNESVQNVRMISRMRNNQQYVSSINGRSYPINNLDIYNLIDAINNERALNDVLISRFKFNEEQLSDFLGLHIPESNHFILDTRTPFVHYYNNIETDKETEDFDKTYTIFEQKLQQFPRVRHSLLHYVHFLDPTTTRGQICLLSSINLLKDEFPIKIGIIPFFKLGNSLSRKVAFAFYHLSLHVNDTVAIKFLTDTFHIANYNSQRQQAPPSESAYYASYLHNTKNLNYTELGLLNWTELHKLYAGSKELDMIIETQKHIDEKGFVSGYSYLNGRYIPPLAQLQGIYQEIQRSIMELQPLIQHYKPDPDAQFDPFELLKHKLLLVNTLNSRLISERIQPLGIYNLANDRQLDFINFISSMNWDHKDEGNISSYYLLFTPESENNEVLKVFNDFIHQNHTLKSAFKINPTIPESLNTTFSFINNKKTTLVVNGRVIQNFNFTDICLYQIVDKWMKFFIMKPYKSIIKNFPAEEQLPANAYLSAIIMDWKANMITRMLYSENFWKYNNTLIYSTKDSKADITWDLSVNPLSRQFQRISSIINWAEKQNILNIHLCLLPPATTYGSETILTTYYRNALDSDHAVFRMLNDTTTYSALPDMPLTWVTESMYASTDLDNILLSQLNSYSQQGTYILTNILMEGVCYTIDGETAEGTELALFDVNGEKKSDTIAMRNGYFQLQANPGAWYVELGGSRSNSIYQPVKIQNVISSFASAETAVKVEYRKGMEGMKVSNMTDNSDYANTDRVDVFSVASGHLYERLLKIMMLSVRSRSKYNVKFWLIKNFLSPTFKATLPIMAKQYNFSYQLIYYKWPTWLRQQTEKQRIIWGNKILFLDTIFPLDLDRVIYIDADQIVRTDLNELMRMDFHGAPYAFTPMCGSRNETEPFRFWKQGYWLEHLRGKPYHISALFAIDLRKFRQMNAGDVLRYHYQKLSADPYSLSNLDQDLPNDIQDLIPIYSLPQEWLWCETWCSDETMDKAKTIDLCNNPLTKAPKLEIAQKRIHEWPHFDELARNISADPHEYQKQFFKD